MKGKILITGSNGLLGQKIISQLSAEGEFDFLATSNGANRMTSIQFNYSPLDITNAADVNKVIESYKPTAVINTAAMTNVDQCEDDREGAKKLNVIAVQNLIDACKKWDCHLVHLSTDFVFDGEDGPYKEDDIPNPLSYYAQTKNDADNLVRESGLKWAVVRTMLVYGVVEDMSRSNVVLLAKGGLEKGDAMNVVDDQFRMPTLSEDLAKACIEIVKRECTGYFHISGKDMMSILDLVNRVGAHYNLNTENVSCITSESLNQSAKRPPKTGFILDKARKELDYNPVSFEEGLDIVLNQLK